MNIVPFKFMSKNVCQMYLSLLQELSEQYEQKNWLGNVTQLVDAACLLLAIAADVMRQRLKGNEVTYGVVRNINYTSESYTGVVPSQLRNARRRHAVQQTWHGLYDSMASLSGLAQ